MKKRILIVLGGLVALLAAAIVALALMGMREGAGRIRASVDIARDPPEVFRWVTETNRVTQWLSWLVEVRSDAPGPIAPGRREVWVMDDPHMKRKIEIAGEFVAVEPGRKLALRLHMVGGFDGTASYTLTDLGDGRTRLEHVGNYRYDHWFARLMEPLVTPQAQEKLEADLNRLKELAEREAAAPRSQL